MIFLFSYDYYLIYVMGDRFLILFASPACYVSLLLGSTQEIYYNTIFVSEFCFRWFRLLGEKFYD